MENIEDKAMNDRKEKIKSWLKNPYNLALLAILLLYSLTLLYYFNLTKDQPLWYDEAEYMSTAKHWAFDIPYSIHQERPPLFPFLAAILFKVGFGLLPVKFFLEIIPAVLTILFIYFLINEMYENKKLALITSFIFSVSWIHLFYTMRLMTDTIGFLFGVLIFFCFWKGYINNKGSKYIWLMGFFIALSFLIRLTGILYIIVIILFLLFTEGIKPIKNKHFWIALLVAILTISPYLLWSYSSYGTPFAFKSGYGGVQNIPPGWWMLQLLYDYPEKIFFVFFIIGFLTVLPMFLSLDLIIFKKNKRYFGDFFNFLTIIFTLFFFIYFLRSGENRWLIMMSVGIFTFSAKGIILVYDFANKKLNKKYAIFMLLIILFFGAYYQVIHTDSIIKNKKDTYKEVMEAAKWIKENSDSTEIVVSASEPQNTFYSERKTITHYNLLEHKYYSPEEFDKIIQKYFPKYYVVSIFEPSVPQWTYTYPENKSNFNPVKIWFADAEQKQPVLIIYEITYNQSQEIL